jgi:hypothetical protein
MGRAKGRQPRPGKKKKTPLLYDNDRIYFAPDGAQYMVLDVGGGGLCALLGVIALAMFAAGIPFEVIFATVSGELTGDVREYVQYLRTSIVSTCGDQFVFADGEELASFDDVIHKPSWVIMTRAMWERVTLYPTGYLDGRAVLLLAKFLGLDGFRIVKHEDGLLVPCHASGHISDECPMLMYDGHGHFKALIPLRGVPLVSLVC